MRPVWCEARVSRLALLSATRALPAATPVRFDVVPYRRIESRMTLFEPEPACYVLLRMPSLSMGGDCERSELRWGWLDPSVPTPFALVIASPTLARVKGIRPPEPAPPVASMAKAQASCVHSASRSYRRRTSQSRNTAIPQGLAPLPVRKLTDLSLKGRGTSLHNSTGAMPHCQRAAIPVRRSVPLQYFDTWDRNAPTPPGPLTSEPVRPTIRPTAPPNSPPRRPPRPACRPSAACTFDTASLWADCGAFPAAS